MLFAFNSIIPLNRFSIILFLYGFLIIPCTDVFSQAAKADTGLVHQKTITGAIRPKSVVHNNKGLFFAQNMMYRHSITVYKRDFSLVKTISDEISFKDFGKKGFQGKHQGSPVEAAFSPDGRFAWVSNYQMFGEGFDNPGSDNCKRSSAFDKSYLYKIDTDQLRITTILQAGCVPKHLACSPDGRFLLVSNWCSGDLSIFDARVDTLLRSLALGNYPRGVAIDSKSRFAYIAVMGAYKIARVDLQNFSIRFMEKVGRTPRHICLSPDDRFLYVSLNAEGKVLKYDLKTLKLIKAKSIGTTPRSMVLSADGSFLYVVNYKDNQMSKLRTSDMAVVQRVKTNNKPIGITLDSEENTLWVACYTGSIMIFKDHGMKSQPLLAEAPELPLQQGYFPFFYAQPPFRLGEEWNTIPTQSKEEKLPEPPPEIQETPPVQAAYCIILGSFQDEANADKAKKDLADKGVETRILVHERGKRLAYGAFSDRESAESALSGLGQSGWVLKLE